MIRGEGDAEATKLFAEAHGQNPEFFSFVRSLEAYAKSFSAADLVLIKSVAGDSGYSKSGEDIVALDTDQLVFDIKSNTGVEAQAISEIDSMTKELVSLKQDGDLIVLMSNGDFGGLKDRLVEQLGAVS